MRNYILSSVFVALIGMACFTASSFAQPPELTKKQDLVMEFRRLTGADRVNMSINLSTEDIRNSLSEIVDKDSDLTDSQKQELRKYVEEGYARVDKLARDFLADKDQLNKISEEVIFKLYDNTYTEAELGEAIAFYQTPTGKKTAAFLPALSAEAQKGFAARLLPKLQAVIEPVSESETTKLKQKITEMKAKKPAGRG
jgi:uncharacterized protein